MLVKKVEDNSLRAVAVVLILAAIAVIVRLFILQVVEYRYYSALAMDTHEIYKQLYPRRGSIFLQDTRTRQEYPVAVNRSYYLVYAVPHDISPVEINSTTNYLADLLKLAPENKAVLLQRLSKSDDLYEPVAKKVSEEMVEKIKSANLPGIHYTSQEYRYYPEGNLAANSFGFVGFDEEGRPLGRYGIEGFWDSLLAGKGGFLAGERGALGSWISLAGRTLKQAEDGADLLLTIDRTLQYKACERLREGFEEYKAKNASLIIMNPGTGAILAMCSLPDFDPNNYGEVKDAGVFNNTAVFTPYEPGSVFKSITMAIALDLGLVNPATTFFDSGVRIINDYVIHNALNKSYGNVTMTQVLENSINIGMIWVEEKIGQDRFKDYMEKFGFGKKTGIGLETEAAGDISSFSKTAAIYNANASFGQGFTATPLQLVVAYATLANGGKMPKPFIVDEIRYPNGQIEKTEPQISDSVISPRTAKLITGMLVSVVEKGHSKPARLEHYYSAAKTGTAQIAKQGKYTDETNHTFAGYLPADRPRFVILVKYEAPQRNWAESTAAPVFKDIAKFALDYYGIAGER